MKKMLVAEDDLLSQNVLKKVFKNEFEVDICESSEQFYEKFMSHKYDIIIMDISIRGKKSGLDLIREVKSSPNYYGTPIISLTAHAQMKMRQTAIESGTDLFITKPVFNNVLREAVSSLLKKS